MKILPSSNSADLLPFDLHIDEIHVQIRTSSLILGSVCISSFTCVRNGPNHTYVNGSVCEGLGVRLHRDNLPMPPEDLLVCSASILWEVLLHNTLSGISIVNSA